jgi:hypothetical protein
VLIDQSDEIGILRHDNHVGIARGAEDLSVRGAVKVQVANGNAVNR